MARSGKAHTDEIVERLFDRQCAEVRADPYPLYEALRHEDRLPYSEQLQAWVATHHEDAVSVLRDKRWSNDPRNASNAGEYEIFDAFSDFVARILLFMDAPDHTRLRSLVSKAFTPRVVEQLRAGVEAAVGAILDEAEARGSLDLMADLAYPLPVTVIAELLGVPVGDRDLLKQHSRSLVWLIEWQMPADKAMEVGGAALAVADYLMGVIEERRSQPRDDLISALVAAEEAGDRLSPEELLTTCILILIAGHETTMNLIGNGTVALLRHPAELRHLSKDPSLDRSAVEELLRYDGPIQLTARTAIDDLELAGRSIKKGQQVMVLLGAVNRDPVVFGRAGQLDLARADNHHMAFGHGAHFCLGASLARLEAQVVLSSLAGRFPEMSADVDHVAWRETMTIRGVQELPLTLA